MKVKNFQQRRVSAQPYSICHEFPVNKKSIVRAPRFSVSAVSTVIASIGCADCLVESISGLIFPCFSIPSFGCVTDCGATARTRQPNGSPGVFGYFGDVTYRLGLAPA